MKPINERYCPACKQNVPISDLENILDSCCNCGSALDVIVSTQELEELCAALGPATDIYCADDDAVNRAKELLTKFKSKYLEAK